MKHKAISRMLELFLKIRSWSVSNPFWILLAIVFIGSRVLLHAFGVYLQDGYYLGRWQILDPIWLREHLLESLLYLHSQPPLLNFLVGLIAMLPEAAFIPLWNVIFSFFGLVLCLSVYGIGLQFNFRQVSALLLAFFVSLMPQTILYENFLLYVYPVSAFLALSILLLIRFLVTGSKLYIWGFVLATSIIALSWSLFHLVWLAVLYVLVWIAARREKRDSSSLRLSLCVGLALVFCLYLKNFMMFGTFSASSWQGMSLARMTHGNGQLIAQLLDDGRLSIASRYAVRGAFKPIVAEEQLFAELNRYPEVVSVSSPLKSSGYVNYNFESYVHYSQMLQRDAFTVLFADPRPYLRRVGSSLLRTFLIPSSSHEHLYMNRPKIAGWAGFLDSLLLRYAFWKPSSGVVDEAPSSVPYPIRDGAILQALIIIAMLVYVSSRLVKSISQPAEARTNGIESVWPALTWLIIWIIVVPSSINGAETERIRFVIEPLFVVLIAAMVREWVFQISRIKFVSSQ